MHVGMHMGSIQPVVFCLCLGFSWKLWKHWPWLLGSWEAAVSPLWPVPSTRVSELYLQEKGGPSHCLDPPPLMVLPNNLGAEPSSTASTEPHRVDWLDPSLRKIKHFLKCVFCIFSFQSLRGGVTADRLACTGNTVPQFNVKPCCIQGNILQSARSQLEGLMHQQKTDRLFQIISFYIILSLLVAWMLQWLQ